MKLRYSVGVNDLRVFAKHFVRHSPDFRRRVRNVKIYRCAVTVLLFGLIAALDIFRPSSLLIFASVSLIIDFAYYPAYYRRSYERRAVRAYESDDKGRFIGERELLIAQDSLILTSPTQTKEVLWSGIESIEREDGYTFIYISSLEIATVPKASVFEGDYETFVDSLVRAYRENSEIASS